jgi:hypothetical protein
MRSLASLIGLAVWLGGIVIAQGFWSTFFAIFFPLWAWYLVIERVVLKFLS